jgi:hypothetical protein
MHWHGLPDLNRQRVLLEIFVRKLGEEALVKDTHASGAVF